MQKEYSFEPVQLSFPEKFNAAERFVDWNVQQGRDDKVAIYYQMRKLPISKYWTMLTVR